MRHKARSARGCSPDGTALRQFRAIILQELVAYRAIREAADFLEGRGRTDRAAILRKALRKAAPSLTLPLAESWRRQAEGGGVI